MINVMYYGKDENCIMKKTHEAVTGNGSALRNYQDVIVGSRSFLFLLYYEICIAMSPIPGALGMVLRKIFWPCLFGSCGKGVLFGTNVLIRHPRKIKVGRSVIISDGCILDGRNSGEGESITVGDNVILSNMVMLSCKDGTIVLGKNSGVNAQAVIQSTNQCPVVLGEDVIIGQGCLIIGGGNYNIDDIDIPIRKQGISNDGGVNVGDNVWIGGKATVLGGVTIGHGSVVAAAAVMTRSVEPFSICKGVPGRVTGVRS